MDSFIQKKKICLVNKTKVEGWQGILECPRLQRKKVTEADISPSTVLVLPKELEDFKPMAI